MPVAAAAIYVNSVHTAVGNRRSFFLTGRSGSERPSVSNAQGYDIHGRRTDGCSNDGPRWSWKPRDRVQWNGPQFGWTPSLTALAPGPLTVIAGFDGVSGETAMTFR